MTNDEPKDQSGKSQQNQQENQHWYIDRDKIRQGPFSTRDIQNFVMEGTLRLDDQIIDAFSGQIQEASYVFLPLNDVLPRSDEANAKAWQPPPRPAASQPLGSSYTIHSQTREIDYFALVAHTKKRKIFLAGSPEGKKKKPKQQQLSAGVVGSQKPSRRFSEKLEDSTRNIRIRASGFWKVLHQSPHHLMYKAAAVAFIGTGIFGIVKTTSTSGRRQPAAASPQPVQLDSPLSKDLKATAKSKPGLHGAMPSASERAIGQGQNPVARDIGQDSAARAQITPSSQEAAPPNVTPSEAAGVAAEPSPPSPPSGETPPGEMPVTAEASPPSAAPTEGQEPAQHFDPSTFEAVNTPVTPPELPANDAGDPAAANRAPAAPEGPVAEVQTSPPTATAPEGSQESIPTP